MSDAAAHTKIRQILIAAHRWIEDGSAASANQAKVAIGRAEILIEKHGLRREDFHFPGDRPRPDPASAFRAFDFAGVGRAADMEDLFRAMNEALRRSDFDVRSGFRRAGDPVYYDELRRRYPPARPLGCTCPPDQDWKLRHAAECGLSCTCPKGYAIGRLGHTQACVERRQRASGLSGTRADHVIFDEDYRRPGGFSDPFNEPPQRPNCRCTINPQQGEFDANGRPRRRKL